MEPKVTLLSWTEYPLETIYAVWMASKTEDELMIPSEIAKTISRAELEKTFDAIIAQRIPIGEHINFVFMMENISVSWREQAVRHRIGVSASPERLGVDIISDLASSSFWSQSMRIQNMGRFASNRMYRVPSSLDGKVICNGNGAITGMDAISVYEDCMRYIQEVYGALVNSGVPMEDAREVIPLAAQHRISWSLNMSSLQHIMGERGCWILQLGLWGPIIMGMINELATKVHPLFRNLVSPPCIKGNTFKECIYKEECRRRLVGDDKLPPCPLHLHYHVNNGKIVANVENIPMSEEMKKRAEEYRIFWGRSPYTGKKMLCARNEE